MIFCGWDDLTRASILRLLQFGVRVARQRERLDVLAQRGPLQPGGHPRVMERVARLCAQLQRFAPPPAQHVRALQFIFAGIIAVIGSHMGLNAKGGAEGVGNATTVSVVTSFILIILADCVVTGVFYFSNM